LKRAAVLTDVLSSSAGWQFGIPPERPLLAYLAGLSQIELATCLRTTLAVTIDRLEPIDGSTEIRSCAAGTSSFTSHPESLWEFPGGDCLLEAFEAARGSDKFFKNSIKSLTWALEAMQLAVGAVVEREDQKRSPAQWQARREAVASEEPAAVLKQQSPEQRDARARSRRKTWVAVLEMLARDT
jgi:hypothetical protein